MVFGLGCLVTWVLISGLGFLPFDNPMSNCVAMKNDGLKELAACMLICSFWGKKMVQNKSEPMITEELVSVST